MKRVTDKQSYQIRHTTQYDNVLLVIVVCIPSFQILVNDQSDTDIMNEAEKRAYEVALSRLSLIRDSHQSKAFTDSDIGLVYDDEQLDRTHPRSNSIGFCYEDDCYIWDVKQ